MTFPFLLQLDYGNGSVDIHHQEAFIILYIFPVFWSPRLMLLDGHMGVTSSSLDVKDAYFRA
jgi:hypothetical protein